MSQHSLRDMLINNVEDREIIVWDELQVPPNMESDTDQWVGYFQPLVQILDHFSSHGARPRERPDTVLLVTLWPNLSKLRDFQDCPDAQLFWESLASRGILRLASHETVYCSNWFNYLNSFIQLFWVYFPAPVDEDQLAQITNLRGIITPALGFSVPRKKNPQTHTPAQIWANQTKTVNGQETQLMLWPHFWQNEEKAEFRNIHTGRTIRSPTVMEKFVTELEYLSPVEWKEEFCTFTSFPLDLENR